MDLQTLRPEIAAILLFCKLKEMFSQEFINVVFYQDVNNVCAKTFGCN